MFKLDRIHTPRLSFAFTNHRSAKQIWQLQPSYAPHYSTLQGQGQHSIASPFARNIIFTKCQMNLPFPSHQSNYRTHPSAHSQFTYQHSHSPITRVTSPTKTCRPSKSSKIPDPNPPKENFAEVVGHEDTHLKQKVMVSGVDLDEFAEVQTGESVYERFMREESLAERWWGNDTLEREGKEIDL